MSPEYVRPYLKSNKNDDLGAEAIAEATSRPTMRFLLANREEQSDVHALRHWPARRLLAVNARYERRQHDAAVRCQARPIEIAYDLLARDGWKREWRNRRVGHGGRGWRAMRVELAPATEPYAISGPYATFANLEVHAS